ncbi:MAG: tetratricopeptide repeat protein [Planktothrix sp.]
MGLTLKQQGNIAEAIEQFRRAIELSPNYAPAQYNLTQAQQRSN